MNLLNVNNLSVSFKLKNKQLFQALNSVSFEINSGEVFAIIGESGSGKSVTSKAITQLITGATTSGSIVYNYTKKEIDLLKCSVKQLNKVRQKSISYIFQEPMTALNPLIKCGNQILEGQTFSDEVLKDLLDKVELTDYERINKSYPHQLSGGQRQRVMIAMALAKKPDLLIADEPTTALDVAVQDEVLKLLKRLCKTENLTVLFITHDLLSLKGFADRVAVMYKGSIVEKGSSEAILNSPQHPYTIALIKSRATYKSKGKILPELSGLMNQEGDTNKNYRPQPLGKFQISESPILQLENISKSYFNQKLFSKTETKVLNDISFSLLDGQSLGLIGESGSGKSTIAKLILTIWNKTAGDILYDERKIEDFDNLADQIQLVFQDPYSSLNPKHKVGKAIEEVVRVKSKSRSKEKAIELLQEVGLNANEYNKYPHEFSGGQRQRICIAKTLARNPKIIVLDEATSALDVSVQAKILNLLNELRLKKRLTYILIAHDMNIVSYFCDYIVVLKEGRIIEQGKTANIIEKPKEEYTKSLFEHTIN